jgi:hypothetical protein
MSDDSENLSSEDLLAISQKWQLAPGQSWADIVNELATRVLEKLARDRRGFLNDLYRLDVSEKSLAVVLQSLDSELTQARKIAELILRREIAKAKTRAEYEKRQKS